MFGTTLSNTQLMHSGINDPKNIYVPKADIVNTW